MPESESWYCVVEGEELQQGDLLRNFSLAKPPKNIEIGADGTPIPSPIKIETHHVVVLTQSCDLINNKTGTLLVCPCVSLGALRNLAPKDVRETPERLLKFYEQVRRGYQWPLHMIAAAQESSLDTEIRVVDFRYVALASLSYARRSARQEGRRLRLKSPYVEHLSQAFARFFMRVGLPGDIPPFTRLP